MKTSSGSKTKFVYNNYQFYELSALNAFMSDCEKSGKSFQGALGSFMSLLKFVQRLEKDKILSKTVVRKHMDSDIDVGLAILQSSGSSTAFENNYFCVLAHEDDKQNADDWSRMIAKQNQLLGINVKKSMLYVVVLLLLSALGLYLNWMTLGDRAGLGTIQFGVYTALLICFMAYFTGDVHDYLQGWGKKEAGQLIFPGRSNIKNVLFRIGDMLKFGILIVALALTLWVFITSSDTVSQVQIISMWFIAAIVGFMSRLRFQRSYITILLVQVFLLTLSFFSL